MFNHVDHLGQIRARVEQAQSAFKCIGMGALLDDRGTFTVVFAHHNQCTTHHARGSKVGERVRCHIGAHNGLPSDRATQWVVDAGTQHGGGGSLVGASLNVHAQFLHQRFGLHHHIQQMRHRRALVTAHVGHARLQQRFGHGQDAFAVKGLTFA